MKLAEALTLRKQLNAAMTTLGVQAFSIPATQNLVERVDLQEAPSVRIAAAIKYKPVMAVIGERDHTARRLAEIDSLIHQLNSAAVVKIPASMGYNFLSTGHSNQFVGVTVDKALSLRKFTSDIVASLKVLVTQALKEPRVKSEVLNLATGPLNQLTITANSYDSAEAHKVLDFFQKQLRILDSAVQEFNWTHELTVPAWVTESFDLQKYLNVEVQTPATAVVPALVPLD